jgi:esterase/lipase superfamily enzyme
MQRSIQSWFSPSLQKEMPIVTYGTYGFALLLIPTAGADYLEYERFQLIDHLSPFINAGKLKVFSIDSINKESWMNKEMLGEHKAIRHNQFNEYVYNEVIPFIKNATSPETPIYVAGASLGALHSLNLFLKRPDLIQGVIAMSGVYDLTEYTSGFYDMQVYFNSPVHYISNLEDHAVLDQIKRSQHIHIFSGSGAFEAPEAAKNISDLLHTKGIHHELSIWGKEWAHDWSTWRAMLPLIVDARF